MESYIAPEELAKYLPIDRGDSVLVASDVTYLCWLAYREGKIFDLDRLIDCLQEKLGAEGTLLFPTYNWKFCKGIPFDYRKTKSEVGSLSQVALIAKISHARAMPCIPLPFGARTEICLLLRMIAIPLRETRLSIIFTIMAPR